MFSIPPNIIWFMLGIICGGLIFNKKMRDGFLDMINKFVGKKTAPKGHESTANSLKIADGTYRIIGGKMYRLEK